MHIVVLGAGVVGLTTAYCLTQDGHRVTVLDRAAGPACGASFANGAQLSYSYVAPLASPSALRDIPGWLLDRRSPLRFHPRIDPHQWSWCLRFLAACSAGRGRTTTERLLALAFYSRTLVDRLVDDGLEFEHSRTGKLVVYSSAGGLEGARRQLEFQRRFGCRQEVLDTAACLTIEPALAAIRHRIAGGIFTPDEQAGDCRLFCTGLEQRIRLASAGASFVYGSTARRFLTGGDRILGVETEQGVIEADAYVLALGTGSRQLARSAAIALPIYPLKGYSITVPVRDGAAAPRVSITDYARKIVYARLGDRLRIAGMADIVGDDESIDEARLALLVEQAREAFPDSADFRRLEPWAGLRPATPTGMPILGPTPWTNLLLNVGHGALGFTLAMGSARIVADLAAGRVPAIDPTGFLLFPGRPTAAGEPATAA